MGILVLKDYECYTPDASFFWTRPLVKPYFTYCVIIWGNTYKKYLNKIKILQKKIIRIITFSEFNAHTEPLFRKFKIMTTSQLYEYFSSIFVFKSLKNMLPNGLSDMFSHNFVSRKFMDLRSNFCTRKGLSFNKIQLF